MRRIKNIFSDIPDILSDELFEAIIPRNTFRLERIVSRGHSTLKGQWYDQEEDEWVILLKGNAGIAIEGEDDMVVLNPGDYIYLPAHVRHRVEWTDPKTDNVWLAIHFESDQPAPETCHVNK